MSNKRPLVVSGPSGAGKSTILKQIFDLNPGKFSFCVSHTTRSKRDVEVDGVDYHFVNRVEFEQMINENQFVEYAQFGGNYYGTSRKAIEKTQTDNKICVLDLEVNGVKAIKATDLNPLCICVVPPSKSELEKRLRERKTETEESLMKRLAEYDAAIDYAAQPLSYDQVVINENINAAIKEFRQHIGTLTM